MISNKRTRVYINSALILGLISIVLFIVGTVTTMLLIENQSIFRDLFSNLTGSWDHITHNFIRDVISVTGHDNPYDWLFNSTLIISGILMVPCFPAIYFIIREFDNPKPRLLKALTILGVLIGPFITLGGIFNEGEYFVLHIIFAVGAYGFVIFTAFLWGIFVWKMGSDHPYKSFKIWWLDISVNFIIIACLIAYSIAMLFFDQIIWNNLGILEKVTIYAFFVFFITIIIRLILIVNKNNH